MAGVVCSPATPSPQESFLGHRAGPRASLATTEVQEEEEEEEEGSRPGPRREEQAGTTLCLSWPPARPQLSPSEMPPRQEQ